MTADAVGGVWTYALDLAYALRPRGVEVTLALMGPALTDEQRAEAHARGLDLVEGSYRLEWMVDPWRDVERAGEWLMALADRCGAGLVHLNGFSHASLPWGRPALVVAHSCVRTWWRGVHGEDAPGSWDTYTARVGAGLRHAGMVIAPTRALLDDVCREYGSVARSRVIPNGSSAVEAALQPRAKEPLVLTAGRLWDEAKNVGSVCAAAPHVSWPVYLAGTAEGPSGRFVCSGATTYLGQLASAEMAEWFQRAAIYALPARYEPFGLSVVEAAAAGCALVLGDIRTLRENWTGAAVFVPPDNRRALAAAIEELIGDSERREALAALSRERARRFTVGAMADAYVAAYDELVPAAAAA